MLKQWNLRPVVVQKKERPKYQLNPGVLGSIHVRTRELVVSDCNLHVPYLLWLQALRLLPFRSDLLQQFRIE